MAERPVFIAGGQNSLMERENIMFQYYNGFSDAQKKRCIQSLHQAFLSKHPQWRVLEISSHSPEEIGIKLSAFHLPIKLESGKAASVECAFQAGKVFQNGGPYLDLLEGTSRAAKKDPRLRESGRIVGFEFEGEKFPAVPTTYFYNWLYIKALMENPELGDALMEYDAFTDIVFNPGKSLNCQAEAASVYVALRKAGLLEQVMADRRLFIRIVYEEEYAGDVVFHQNELHRP